MNRRNLSIKQWLLLVAVSMALLLIGARLHLKWRLHRVIAALREQGKPTSVAEYEAMREPVPDEENVFVALDQAWEHLDNPTSEESDLLPVIGGSYLGSDKPWNWSPEVERTVSQFLNRIDPTHDYMIQALRRPRYRHIKDERALFDSTGIRPKVVATQMRLAGYQALNQGDTRRAALCNVTQYMMANVFADERRLIDMLVRRSVLQVALMDTEVLLGYSNLNLNSLDSLATAIDRSIELWQLDKMIEYERASWIDAIRNSEEKLHLTLDFDDERSEWENRLEDFKVIAYRMSGLGDLDLLYLLEVLESQERIGGSSVREIHEHVQTWDDILPSGRGEHFKFWSEIALSLNDKVFLRWVELHERLRAARVGIAVTQYRVANNDQLPAQLDILIPEYIDELPTHPVTEAPYQLLDTDTGFSIGAGAPVFSVIFRGE